MQLLDRAGRTVRLTDAGEVYAGHARRALRELAAGQRAVLDVTDLSSGHLRLAVTPTFTAYLVGPLVREFHGRHPGLTLDVREMTQDGTEEALHADALDLGLGFSDPLTSGGGLPGTVRRAPVHGQRAGRGGGQGATLTPAGLVDASFALLSGDFAARLRIDAYFAEHGVRPRVTVEADSVSALVEIVRHTPPAMILSDAVNGGTAARCPAPPAARLRPASGAG